MNQVVNIESQKIEKALTGITGLDEITAGGLPCGRTTLLIGGTGSGKTVFAMQTHVNGAQMYAEPGIFVCFEESIEQLIANAASFGWDLPALERQNLIYLDTRMSVDAIMTGNFDLKGLVASLSAKAKEMHARRVVFDSIGLLLSLMENPLAERQEFYRIHEWLAQNKMMGIITARLLGEQFQEIERYDFLQFMSDSIIQLNHRIQDNVSLREIRVVKYRGSAFAGNIFPMVFSEHGIEIARWSDSMANYPALDERISSGIERLDHMLAGGYYRGSSVLITGAPGTAKTTLGGKFLDAACKRGEPSLMVSFDESPGNIVRNLSSVGSQLEQYLNSGLLTIHSVRSDAYSAEEHLVQIRHLIEAHQPRNLVIDPISAMLKAGGEIPALAFARHLLHLTRSRGLTVLLTSLLDTSNPLVEATPIEISTIADTWIHLAYVVQAGERNRSLTIVKSRGTAHSNQVREMLINDQGVTLENVYSAGGEVLMGTLRWEKENAILHEQQQARADLELKKNEIELLEAETQARIEALKRELETHRAELETLTREQEQREQNWIDRREATRYRREGDALPDETSSESDK